MTQGTMPGYHFRIWKHSVFCMSQWKLLKNKISSSVDMSDTWQFVHCHHANLYSSPALPTSVGTTLEQQ